uniref:HYD1 signature containing ADP-ribosyltransferase family protein n=1 Tax=uncultured Maritalea sp. TaxID=757249 RepID=UPI00260F43C8
DIVPGTKSNNQLSKTFVTLPFHGKKFKNYVAIDVSGLVVRQGRKHVYVIPGDKPLDIKGRIIGTGENER